MSPKIYSTFMNRDKLRIIRHQEKLEKQQEPQGLFQVGARAIPKKRKHLAFGKHKNFLVVVHILHMVPQGSPCEETLRSKHFDLSESVWTIFKTGGCNKK